MKIADLAELWDISIKFLWSDDYLDGIEAFLKANHIKTVLDCAGGTGFPSIALAKRGWAITYSGGSNLMVNRFCTNMEAQNVRMPYYHCNWLGLSQSIPGRFDGVLCRGNSLIYVDSWGKDQIDDCALTHIEMALKEFWLLLVEGGVLYVDIINRKEFDQPQYPLVEEIGEIEIGGQPVSLTWIIDHNDQARTRTCQSILRASSSEYLYTYSSYLLRHNELVDLLLRVGFKKVQEIAISGEDSYNVYVAYK